MTDQAPGPPCNRERNPLSWTMKSLSGLAEQRRLPNLWPQPLDGDAGAHKKDELEGRLHDWCALVELRLAQAQDAIASDWLAGAYGKCVG